MENPIFVLLGAAGFVAPRHIEAIYSVGGELCCACDKSDSVGVLDRRFPHCQFFLSENELESYVEKNQKLRILISFRFVPLTISIFLILHLGLAMG